MIKVALMYDFDKTLSPKDMQEFSFIPALGFKNPKKFWEEVNVLKNSNQMDSILAYMYMMLKKADAAQQPIRRSDFVALGKDVLLYPGVEDWFDRINEAGRQLGLEIEHYIISSGLKEIIEGTSIADKFRKIYACRYYYDENGVAKWPALVVNYTTKTQYIFRINKQVLSESDDTELNHYVPHQDRPIPFTRMIYVGDGLTDVPCMKLVKEYGGHSIAVYNTENKKHKKGALQLIKENRVNFTAAADYSSGSDMEVIMKAILNEIAAQAELERLEQMTNQ